MILFINACVRENSRTEEIAKAYLRRYPAVTQLRLDNISLQPLDAKALEERNEATAQGDFSSPAFELARQFAQAEEIVIAAPFWDLSFPAQLRLYLERICVTGLTFRYSDQGIPVGLCRARKLTFITTSGGPYQPDFSYDYIRAVTGGFFGIPEHQLIYAENLDVVGNDPRKLVADCIARHCS